MGISLKILYFIYSRDDDTIAPYISVYHIWLVVWNMTFMTFHSVGNVIIPTDELHHFSEGQVNHQPDNVFEGAGCDGKFHPWWTQTQWFSCQLLSVSPCPGHNPFTLSSSSQWMPQYRGLSFQMDSNSILIGGLEPWNFIFHFIYGIILPKLTNSYVSRWLLHHQPGYVSFFSV